MGASVDARGFRKCMHGYSPCVFPSVCFFCVRTEENDARVAARRPLATAAQTPIQQRSVASNLC